MNAAETSMLLVFSALALAKPPWKEVSLLIPVVPVEGLAAQDYGVSVPLPKRASRSTAWTSDSDLISCEADVHRVTVRFEVEPGAWPYDLPGRVTCSQGDIKLSVRLGFREPDARIWRAADGAIVVPHRTGSFLRAHVESPLPIASAVIEAGSVGVACEPGADGQLVVDVKDTARAGTAQCKVVLASGESLAQKIVLVAY